MLKCLGVAAIFVAGLALPSVTLASTFDFTSTTATQTPFTLTSGGVTASFSSPGDPGAFLIEPSMFHSLGSTVLISQGIMPEELDISFSAPVQHVDFPFATFDLGPPTILNIAYYDGATLLGTAMFTGTVPPLYTFPEGEAAIDASAITSLVITDPDALAFAIGMPEPSGMALIAVGGLGLAMFRRRLPA